ncbi:unnamed protein product, partial [Cuscuta epithymum]
MGNNCAHGKISGKGFDSVFWWFRIPNKLKVKKKVISNNGDANREPVGDIASVQTNPPEIEQIEKGDNQHSSEGPEHIMTGKEGKNAGSKQDDNNEKPVEPSKPRKPLNTKRMLSAGLQVDSVLKTKTGNLKDYFTLEEKLGHGQFGTTFLCTEKATGLRYACKSIAKRKLLTREDVDDVRREIEIMHHLAGHPNVVSIKGSYEDAVAVHVVMELCAGGELFDRIVKRGHYSERQAAGLARTIVGVVEACHSLGVMHRDLKPENFLFVNEKEDSPLKTIDFGLSTFFKP